MVEPAEPVLIEGLVKRFGKTTALNGLDLRVQAGQVHGFLGPNGAGKSTTIRVLLGILRADAGRVRLFGGDPWVEGATLHRQVAYVPGEVTLWPQLTGGEVIDLLGQLRGGLNAARRTELLECFELDPSKKCRDYSKGNRQKVVLVAALASDAQLLILDEPTSGLDPLMEALFQRQVSAERERGRTVLLSSHILSEVEALCNQSGDEVSIVRAGKVVENGTLSQLRHLSRTSLTAVTDTEPAGLRDNPQIHQLVIDSPPGEADRVRIQLQVAPQEVGALLPALHAARLRSLISRPPTLEELFLHEYRTDTNADTSADT